MILDTMILSWETMDLTKRCYDRVLEERKQLQKQGHDLHVIIVDNGSIDGTQDWLKTIEDEHTKILNLDKNYGNCIARNRGLEYCKGKYVYMLDCDLRPINGSFVKMLEFMEKEENSRIGVLGMASWNQSHVLKDETLEMPPLEIAEVQRSPYTGLALAYTQYGIWRMSLFLEHGLRFVEAYPFDRGGHGYEDDDMGGQIEYAGYEIKAVMNVCYLHNFHSSGKPMERSNIDSDKMTEERRVYVTNKWDGLFKPIPKSGVHP